MGVFIPEEIFEMELIIPFIENSCHSTISKVLLACKKGQFCSGKFNDLY